MATLIFDIETIGEAWDELDPVTHASLSRWIDRGAHDAHEKERLMQDLKEGLGFSPLTGSIAAIGVYDLERAEGAVYYRAESADESEDGEFALKVRSEKEMLSDFWEGARSYDTFVTFNGRSFDVPFLLLRSVACGISPSCDLMEGRYLYQQKNIRHVDLYDQLSFYGAMHRKGTLHLYCRAFGIESPKAEGIVGDDVAALFANKRFRDIARYNARDVRATASLYEKWLQYLAPASFKSDIML